MSSFKPVCTAYLSGINAMALNFNSEPECIEWYHEIMVIKDKIALINTTWYPEPRLSNYQNQWVPMVKAFEQKWGSDYVPADIKSTLEKVKSSI